MQQAAPPPWSPVPNITTSPVRPGFPRSLVAGFVLAGFGIVLAALSNSWILLGFGFLAGSGFTTFLQAQVLLQVAGFLALQLGLFLILAGIFARLPNVAPWARLGPVLILVGALLVTGFGLFEFAMLASVYSLPPSNGISWPGLALVVVEIAGYALSTVGLVFSLFAVAKGAFLRTPVVASVPRP